MRGPAASAVFDFVSIHRYPRFARYSRYLRHNCYVCIVWLVRVGVRVAGVHVCVAGAANCKHQNLLSKAAGGHRNE